jgi:hypothetical protein
MKRTQANIGITEALDVDQRGSHNTTCITDVYFINRYQSLPNDPKCVIQIAFRLLSIVALEMNKTRLKLNLLTKFNDGTGYRNWSGLVVRELQFGTDRTKLLGGDLARFGNKP